MASYILTCWKYLGEVGRLLRYICVWVDDALINRSTSGNAWIILNRQIHKIYEFEKRIVEMIYCEQMLKKCLSMVTKNDLFLKNHL